jgi:hypothetical protein
MEQRDSRILMAAALVLAAAYGHAGFRQWDVGDYVQDGIIAHYDAIRNVGADQPHSNNPAEWLDLSPKGGSAINQATVYGGAVSWTDDACVFNGRAIMKLQQKLELGSNFTIQVASDLDLTVDTRTELPVFVSEKVFRLHTDRSWEGVASTMNLKFVTANYSGITDGNSPYINWEAGRYINAAFGDGRAYLTAGTSWPTGKAWVNSEVFVPELNYTIGGRFQGGTSGGTNLCSVGRFYALRIYSRKLTNAELAWNRAIDEIRYHGASAPPLTNVVVAASENGFFGTEAPGGYAVAGSHVFTASSVTNNGCVFTPAGYTIEVWDRGTGEWGAPTAFSGASYVYSTASDPERVRLTWTWEMIAGIRRFDVGDYVQNGIIAHYDGIRNVGADQPHDNSPAQWRDLSPTGGSAANLATVYGNVVSWADDACVLNGKAIMQTQQPLELGSNFTIQVACDFDMSVDGRQRPAVFASGFDFQILSERSYEAVKESMTLWWWTENYSGITRGNSPTVANWSNGRYVNAAFGDGRAYMTAGTSWPTGRAWGKSDVYMPALTYTFGGRLAGGTSGGTNLCSIGKLHAVRIYSRKLTNEELVWNRGVDEIRYRGAEATIPGSVWVASNRVNCEGNEIGAYKLVGEYTFTAETHVIDGVKYVPVGYVVETWDGATSSWTGATLGAGGSCTLQRTANAPATRLTWRFLSCRGTVLTVK